MVNLVKSTQLLFILFLVLAYECATAQNLKSLIGKITLDRKNSKGNGKTKTV